MMTRDLATTTGEMHTIRHGPAGEPVQVRSSTVDELETLDHCARRLLPGQYVARVGACAYIIVGSCP